MLIGKKTCKIVRHKDPKDNKKTITYLQLDYEGKIKCFNLDKEDDFGGLYPDWYIIENENIQKENKLWKIFSKVFFVFCLFFLGVMIYENGFIDSFINFSVGAFFMLICIPLFFVKIK